MYYSVQPSVSVSETDALGIEVSVCQTNLKVHESHATAIDSHVVFILDKYLLCGSLQAYEKEGVMYLRPPNFGVRMPSCTEVCSGVKIHSTRDLWNQLPAEVTPERVFRFNRTKRTCLNSFWKPYISFQMFASSLHEGEARVCMVYKYMHTEECSVYPSLHVEARFDVTKGASIPARMQESTAIVTTSISNDPIWNDCTDMYFDAIFYFVLRC